MKELHEDDGGDNTEPLEDFFLGPSIEEVRTEQSWLLRSDSVSGSL